MTCSLLSFFWLSCLPEAFAQTLDPINTERPSFSSSPLALSTGYWQIEAGYQFTHDNDSDTINDHTLPNALLRYGFYERFELQLSSAGYTWLESGDVKSNGFNDAGLGVKWQVNNSDAVIPVGLFAGVSLPVGSSDFTSDDIDPSIALFWSHSGLLDLFGTAKVQYSDTLYSLDNAIGISLSLTKNTGAFIEYLATFSEGDGPAHGLNYGVTWLLSNDLQLDINGGVGLNSRANDYFAGMGIAYRF